MADGEASVSYLLCASALSGEPFRCERGAVSGKRSGRAGRLKSDAACAAGLCESYGVVRKEYDCLLPHSTAARGIASGPRRY
jgi:hypothetical protein